MTHFQLDLNAVAEMEETLSKATCDQSGSETSQDWRVICHRESTWAALQAVSWGNVPSS